MVLLMGISSVQIAGLIVHFSLFSLEKGAGELTLQALDMPGNEVING